ncbi:hypothetical protein FHR49_000584 [Xanthomonas campestris]
MKTSHTRVPRWMLGAVLAASLPGLALAAETVGCQSLSQRYPWGSAEPLRTWTPNNTQPDAGKPNNAGVAQGQPFDARLVIAVGEASAQSRRTVLLESSDGCRRRYQLNSFGDADLRYVANLAKAHPVRKDTRSYATAPAPDTITPAMLVNGSAKKYETQHFVFWYGVDRKGESYRDVASRGIAWDDFVTQSAAWLERVWEMNAQVLNAPMPYADAAQPKRINVYLCATGLPYVQGGDLTDCGAAGGQSMGVTAWALGYGSFSMAHEFIHVIQYYSGGYRNLQAAGWFWETNANWSAYQTTRMDDQWLSYYYSNLENGPFFPQSRYGAHPFLMYLDENDATRPLVWNMWLKNQRNAAGDTLETPVQTLVRLGQQGGQFPNGYRSFAEMVGRYGARLAAFDFASQKAMLDIGNGNAAGKRYVPLKPLAMRGSYASSPERPLNIYGTHVIPLTPDAAATSIAVSLKGRTTADQASWRFTVLALDAQSHPHYAPLAAVEGTASATVTFPLQAASGTSYFLVVTATPYRYSVVPTGEEQLAGKRATTFPYEVAIQGATPLVGPAATCYAYKGSGGLDRNWNTNGHNFEPQPCR